MKKTDRCMAFSFIMGVVFMLNGGDVLAQTFSVKGRIIDENNEPLIGATVKVKGVARGTVSNVNGEFALRVSNNEVVEVSYLGYMPYQKKIMNNESALIVAMHPDAVTMQEVVVVGYGTQRRSHFAGAIASISPENQRLDEVPADGLDKLLQGRLSGVLIQDKEGQVGTDAEISIRGNASFSATNSPLIVVDGMPIKGGSLSDINVSDVESLEVLKDAASTAIYGSRGANGVIMITTRKGQKGKAKFNVKYQYGYTDVLKYFDTYTMGEYAESYYKTNVLYPWETGYLAAGQSLPSGVNEDGGFDKGPNGKSFLPYDKYLTTTLNPATQMVYNTIGAGYAQMLRYNELVGAVDPQRSVTQSGQSNKVTISASGDAGRVNYFVSTTYSNERGVMKNNSTENLSLTANIQAKLNDKLKLDIKLNPRFKQTRLSSGTQLGGALRWLAHPLYFDDVMMRMTTTKGGIPAGATVGTPLKSRDLRNIWLMNDDFSDYVLDGKGKRITVNTYSGTGDVTSYAIAEDTKDMSTQYGLTGNLGLTYDIMKGLVFRTSAGAFVRVNRSDYWQGSYSRSKGLDLSGKGYAKYSQSINANLVNESYLTYSHKINGHSFSAMTGLSFEYTDYSVLQAVGQFFPNDYIQTLNYAGEIVPKDVTNNLQEEALVSTFARLNYDFKGRYIVSGTYRLDGSSQFGSNRRWGSFPSVSAAWRLSEEQFMKSVEFISDLKLRVSWGVSGNNSISRYSYVTPVNKVSYTFGTELVTGYVPTSTTLGSADIGWEQTDATNLGFSLGLLNNRILLNVDVYNNITKALLLRNPIVNIAGYQNEWANIGKMSNKGVEIEVNSRNVSNRSFMWTTNLVFTSGKNILLDYGGVDKQYFNGYQESQYRLKVGRPVGEFYGYKTTGEIWKTAEEIKQGVVEGKAFSSTVTGELKYVDTNGDGVITEDDKTSLGHSTPKFEWGLTNSFQIRNFDLSFMFQGSHGAKVWNMTNVYGGNYLRWIQDDVYVDAFHGNKPMHTRTTITGTDYFVEDASYISLRNVSLSYTLPKYKVRLYLSGRNLLYFTAKGYNGINPEFRSDISGRLITGEQRMTVVPTMRSISAGIDVTF